MLDREEDKKSSFWEAAHPVPAASGLTFFGDGTAFVRGASHAAVAARKPAMFPDLSSPRLPNLTGPVLALLRWLAALALAAVALNG